MLIALISFVCIVVILQVFCLKVSTLFAKKNNCVNWSKDMLKVTMDDRWRQKEKNKEMLQRRAPNNNHLSLQLQSFGFFDVV